MVNYSDDSAVIKPFVPPDACPKCGRLCNGSVNCKRCGLYFFRYDSIQKSSGSNNTAGFENQDISHGKSFFNLKNICMIFLFTVSVTAALSIANNYTPEKQSTGRRQHSMNVPVVETAAFAGDDEKNNVIEIKEVRNESWVVTSKDVFNNIYTGREYFYEGVTFYEQKKYPEARKKFAMALEILEKCHHPESIAKTKLNLAICFHALKDYDNSLKYFEETLNLSRKNHLARIEDRALQGKSLLLNQTGLNNKALFDINS